jgi:hypothetical protein
MSRLTLPGADEGVAERTEATDVWLLCFLRFLLVQ